MTRSRGLYGHIQRNTLKSGLLLSGFVGLVFVLWYTVQVFHVALFWWPADSADLATRLDLVTRRALAQALDTWWVAFVGAAAWLTLAFWFHATIIRLSTGAVPVSREEQPKLHRMVENLALAAGLPCPQIEIMPSAQLNAYAAGLSPDTAVVAVTRGLLQELEDDELEAVLAHEITHIANRDVRLLVIASILASALTVAGAAAMAIVPGWERGRGDPEGGGDGFLLPAAGFVAVIFAVTAIMVAFWLAAAVYLFALAIKFAVSRSREFAADAGAVELTKNPDALIAALEKISGRDAVPVTNRTVQAMMISFDCDDLFATHPSIEDRIAALKTYAGGVSRPRRTRGVRYFGTWGRNGRTGLRSGRASPLRG
jgi:heat shock protein HtpX